MPDFAFNPAVASGVNSSPVDITKTANTLTKLAKDQSRVTNTPYPPWQNDLGSDSPSIGTAAILSNQFKK